MSPLILRLKQAFIALILLGGLAVFIAVPLMSPDFNTRQGIFDARILSSAAGMGVAGRPIVRARVEDETGRIFWIGLPPANSAAPDTPLRIEVWCETEAFESCAARYSHGQR